MTDNNQRVLAEAIFERGQRREREISDGLKLEAKRHEAVVQNMHRKDRNWREWRFELLGAANLPMRRECFR